MNQGVCLLCPTVAAAIANTHACRKQLNLEADSCFMFIPPSSEDVEACRPGSYHPFYLGDFLHSGQFQLTESGLLRAWLGEDTI